MILLIIVIIILSILLGGLFAIRFRDKLHLILGFSAGAVMGVAFFDLMPESIELASKRYDISLITLFFALGFTAYLVLGRWFPLHPHDCVDCRKPRHQSRLAIVSL